MIWVVFSVYVGVMGVQLHFVCIGVYGDDIWVWGEVPQDT